MTEYWVSKKQYFCKYCKIFIRDDAPSRNQHETGLKHQGNKERFLRNIYKTGERSQKEKEEEARMMAKINAQAEATHAASTSTPGSSTSSPTPGPSTFKPKPKSTDPYANYTSAADLGYIDEQGKLNEQLAKAEEERAKVGQAGEWQVVQPVAVRMPEIGDMGDVAEYSGGGVGHRLGGAAGFGEQEDKDDVRNFNFTDASAEAGPSKRKKPDVYDDDEFDPMEVLKKVKFNKGVETKDQREEREKRERDEEIRLKGLDRAKWGGPKIGADGRVVDASTEPEAEGTTEAGVKDEEGVKAEEEARVVGEGPAPVQEEEKKPATGGSLFKKRRAAGAGGSRGFRAS